MLNLRIPNMSCGHCAATIEKAVKTVDPCAKIRVDVAEKTVSIDTTARAETIKAVVETAGYPSTNAVAQS